MVGVLLSDKETKRQKDYSTQSSQVVSNPSTIQARRGLTSLIGREVVLSSWYGRNRQGLSFTHSGPHAKLFSIILDVVLGSRTLLSSPLPCTT